MRNPKPPEEHVEGAVGDISQERNPRESQKKESMLTIFGDRSREVCCSMNTLVGIEKTGMSIADWSQVKHRWSLNEDYYSKDGAGGNH
jgi:hypothetical protein